MPYLLQDLFEETKNHNIQKKDRKKLSRACKYIKNYSLLPELNCPSPNSTIHKKDLEDLLQHYHNPSLPKKFLTKSHDSVKKLFKDYCKENNLCPDWSRLKDYGKDVSSIVAHLKYKHNRPRPKEFLDSDYDEIEDMFNPSFPSGHTASAYFIAEMLSTIYEAHRQELKELARLIGHSRIENGVHFPSDVLYGRFIGETLAQLCKQQNLHNDLIDFEILRKDSKNAKNYLLDKFNDKNLLKNNLAEFIFRSNQIENINVSFKECINAVSNFLSGYVIDKCTKDKNIKTHLNGIVACFKMMPMNSPYKMIQLHKVFDKNCLDKGKPGEIRLESGHAKNLGNDYADPEMIISYLERITSQKNEFVKHILYEWIHPFNDGNGRSGRIMLLCDSDFDFESVLEFCGNKYINYITGYIDHFKDLKNILYV